MSLDLVSNKIVTDRAHEGNVALNCVYTRKLLGLTLYRMLDQWFTSSGIRNEVLSPRTDNSRKSEWRNRVDADCG